MVSAGDKYGAIYQRFHWHVPEYFNIAEVCSRRWAGEPARVALYCEDEDGARSTLTYAQLQRAADRLSHRLRELGVAPGTCVAIALPQRAETAIALMACLQMGAIAVPLTVLFGPEALQYRLEDSGAEVAICDSVSLANLYAIEAPLPRLRHVIGVHSGTLPDDPPFDYLCWDDIQDADSGAFESVDTRADSPALIIYTSGTTGAPKGAVIPHRALIGNLTGFVASQNWFPQPGDVFWSPADWAWTGGLMDALLPTLYFGQPLVGYRGRFSADTAFALLQRYGVTNTFLFPTALKIMMKAVPRPRERYDLKLRAIMSAGEAVGDAVFDWCRDALGVVPNEMFGQTEMNYIVGNSAKKWPARPGSMGRPYPGHQVAVINDDGEVCPPGQTGEVALNRLDIHGHPDPIFFLGYHGNQEATRDKYSGDWCRTGDLASMDEDGYLWYQGRADDMFKAAGYRIGPSEIENCLLKHDAVANAAVVPKPDRERGNLVKAYVVLRAGIAGDEALIEQLQRHVRGKLAPYEYPKEIEFIDALPMTTTGKVQRRVLRLQEEARAAGK
ncbi:MAG TPA: AMP-binding protein [Burkholderiaceae bacterium]